MEIRLYVGWLAVLLVVVTAQKAETSSQNPCVSKETCHECIQTRGCVWCLQPEEFKNGQRCYDPSSNPPQCKDGFKYNPSNEFLITADKILGKHVVNSSVHTSSSSSSISSKGSSGSASNYEAVQIYPQRVSLKLRINQEHRMSIDYAQAEDYPVDLYYLMDLSNSMADDKEKLSGLGTKLANRMESITSNFRLGFGSFVDKVVMPYVSTVPEKLNVPCDKCEAPYGFRNHMKLTTDTDHFSENVRKAAVSGNLDGPEGGFDAIMQAIVCRQEIGWREKARRLLVFSTDAEFHHAGDGKLGGIVKPNDGMCHLSNNGSYTHSTEQDYPSISQINLNVKKNSINMIFAVTSGQSEVYKQLSKHIEGSTSGILSNDSSNVVELVQEQYNAIKSSVEIKDTASSAIKMTYYSKCLSNDLVNTNKCDGLKVGTRVNFEVVIEVKECPKDPKQWNQTFKIYPVGINESLVVDLEMLCACPCELPGNKGYKENASECSGSGTYKCGICECDSTHTGRICECATDVPRQGDKEMDTTIGCRPDNTSLLCSGRGSCVCNRCVCNEKEKRTGVFCECDNNSCDRNKGLLCSGTDHGTCVCGKCVCNDGWTGDACGCRNKTDTCIPPGREKICSGHGTCECGECKCHSDDQGHYSGKYCDKCPTCMGRCEEFNKCVQCVVHKTGPLAGGTGEDCATNCTFTIETRPEVEDNQKPDENYCVYYDEDDCVYDYIYKYDDDGKVIVIAQQERTCPPQVYILGIVLGVIGAIVLIGLALLLLWKLITTIHDRREFAKFEEERSKARWDTGGNPIYKQATSTYKNPAYKGK